MPLIFTVNLWRGNNWFQAADIMDNIPSGHPIISRTDINVRGSEWTGEKLSHQVCLADFPSSFNTLESTKLELAYTKAKFCDYKVNSCK